MAAPSKTGVRARSLTLCHDPITDRGREAPRGRYRTDPALAPPVKGMVTGPRRCCRRSVRGGKRRLDPSPGRQGQWEWQPASGAGETQGLGHGLLGLDRSCATLAPGPWPPSGVSPERFPPDPRSRGSTCRRPVQAAPSVAAAPSASPMWRQSSTLAPDPRQRRMPIRWASRSSAARTSSRCPRGAVCFHPRDLLRGSVDSRSRASHLGLGPAVRPAGRTGYSSWLGLNRARLPPAEVRVISAFIVFASTVPPQHKGRPEDLRARLKKGLGARRHRSSNFAARSGLIHAGPGGRRWAAAPSEFPARLPAGTLQETGKTHEFPDNREPMFSKAGRLPKGQTPQAMVHRLLRQPRGDRGGCSARKSARCSCTATSPIFVPPYTPDGQHHGTAAAVEFAVKALRVRHIIVMGHSNCGGVRGCLAMCAGAEPELERRESFIGR